MFDGLFEFLASLIPEDVASDVGDMFDNTPMTDPASVSPVTFGSSIELDNHHGGFTSDDFIVSANGDHYLRNSDYTSGTNGYSET